MTPPFLLIAEREFRTYVATVSFWVALLVGPVIALLALLAISQLDRTPAAITVGVVSSRPALADAGARALREAASLQGIELQVLSSAKAGRPTIRIEEAGEGGVRVSAPEARVLADPYWSLFVRTVERDLAREKAGLAPAPASPAATTPKAGLDTGAVGRFAVVLTLWMTLTGSLGMLLQAVVRERANRALESLMAAASPWTIVTGKLVGVGAVSLVVLLAWLGSGAMLSMVLKVPGGASGVVSAAGAGDFARSVGLYVLAFALYGFATIAVGVRARDTAVAQNLVRPIFGLLLLAFFSALTAMMGFGDGLAWLAWVPPFTPFVLLMQPPGLLAPAMEMAMIVPTVLATGLAAVLAMKGLTLNLHERRHSVADRRKMISPRRPGPIAS